MAVVVFGGATTATPPAGPVAQPNATSITFKGYFNPPQVWFGREMDYVLEINNTGTTDISAISFKGTLPAGMTDAPGSQAACHNGVLETSVGGFSMTNDDLLAGQSCTLLVMAHLKVATPNRYTVTVGTLTYAGGSIPGFQSMIDVLAPPTVALNIASPILVGEAARMGIVIGNSNRIELLRVRFKIILPAGLVVRTCVLSTCGPDLDPSLRTVAVDLFGLGPGNYPVVEGTIRAVAAGTWRVSTTAPTSTLDSGAVGTGTPASVNVTVLGVVEPSLALRTTSPPRTPTVTPTVAATTTLDVPSAPDATASDTGGVIAAASAPASPYGSALIAGETIPASGSGTAAPGDAGNRGSGGDSGSLLLVLGAVAVAGLAAGVGFFGGRRTRGRPTPAPTSGDSPKD